MKFFYTLFILLITFTGAMAQAGKGKITGKVTDPATKMPVDYATIAVYLQGGKSPVNGTTTDAKGNFAISGLPFGEYQVMVDFIGYKRTTVEHVMINASKSSVALNGIQLTSSQKQLKDVNVTAQKSTVENKIDKLVYNVGNDLTAQGGVATDILKKVPMVTVDIDGNVELLGSPAVKFLINGKPSSIFGASLADALQAIPSSQIKSVEVITSPGAKYDASGTGGIINIILKDNKVQGYNGTVNLTAGTRLENASVNLNALTGTLGVNAYFSGNQTLRSKNLGSRTRIGISHDTTQNQFQNSIGYVERKGYQSGLSMEWNVSKHDVLVGSIGYHHFDNSNELVTNQQDQQLKGMNVYSNILSIRNSNASSNESSVDVNLEYRKSFNKEGQELSIQYNSGYNRNNSDYYQKQDYLNSTTTPSFGSMGSNPGQDHQQEFTADYTQPLGKEGTLETGAKFMTENITTSSNVNTYIPAANAFVFDPGQSNGFDYGRNVYAYYVSVAFPLFDFFKVKAGLRDEYTTTSIGTAGAVIPSYNFLSPSLVLSHKIGKTQNIKIAYNKRIERPDFGDLNPFRNYSDPYNVSYGNPNLRPEIGNGVELNYNLSTDKGTNINITYFFRHNGDDVKQYTFRVDSLQETGGKYYKNVYVQTRANVGSEIATGLNMSVSLPLTEHFTLRPNVIMMQRRVMVNLVDVPSFVMGYEYRFNVNASYQFKNDYAAEAFLNYNTPRTQLQGRNSSFAAYSFAFRKQFWNKKASVGLTANVPFNEYVSQSSTVVQQTPKYSYQNSVREVPFRSFGITLSYKFGKLEFKKDNKEKDNQQPTLPDQN